MVQAYTPEQTLAQFSSQRVEDSFSALTDTPFFLLDLRNHYPDKASDQLLPLLAQLPCPIIGLGGAEIPSALATHLDCVLEDDKWLAPMLRNISCTPVAAMTLVQLSKAIEQLDISAALDMESVSYACLQGGSEYQSWLRNYTPDPAPDIADAEPIVLARDTSTLNITLNRPELRNSITVEMRDALVEALSLAVVDSGIEKIQIQGAGKCFSVGGELREFGRVPDTATGHLVRSLRLPGRWLARVADRCEAYVHGACIGAGAELPAFAHRVVARQNTHFQLPEIHFGLIPGAGGCVSISRRIGRHRFNQLALSGKRINARQAHAWGLVDEISG